MRQVVVADADFLQPVDELIGNYIRGRVVEDGALPDRDFVRFGLTRVLEGDESGRAFLQAVADRALGREQLARSTWFDALQSQRRLQVLEQLAEESYVRWEGALFDSDYLEALPELRSHPVWAVDGHQIEHATHSPRSSSGRYVASGIIYGLCLHTGMMRPLTRFQGDGIHRHEWPCFKETWQRWRKRETRPGMPIIVADPAY